MFNTYQAKEAFNALSHQEKIAKMKEILSLLKKKSDFFAKMYEYFKNKQSIDDVVLDYLYQVVMALIYNQQTDELLVPEKEVLTSLKSRIRKYTEPL
jgi:hypothetical protein